jgi:hypothetical protein
MIEFQGKGVTILRLDDDSVITVSTAKEGFFQGLSTVILLGKWPSVSPYAKLLYRKDTPKEERLSSHVRVSEFLNEYASQLPLKRVVEMLAQTYIESGILKEVQVQKPK